MNQKYKKKYNKEDLFFGYLFILPLFIGMIVFYIVPVFQTLYYSFTKWGMFGGNTWVGLANYKKLLSDKNILNALFNTVRYTVFMVPISIGLSIFLAILLNSKIKFLSFFRTVYFLPAVTMVAAAAMVWKWIFNSEYGILNLFLSKFGVGKINWISDSKYAMLVLVVIGVWMALGRSIVIFLAGLQGIPSTYYEAAEIDGASKVHSFFNITLPLLTPTIFFQTITSIIAALQLYDAIFVIFLQTNPALNSVTSMAYLFYKEGFVNNDKGYAAVVAIVLLVITMIVTLISFATQKLWVHYD